MAKEKKSGIFGKLFGGNKSSCCSVEFEEVTDTESNPKEKTSEKQPGKKEQKNTGCGCGC